METKEIKFGDTQNTIQTIIGEAENAFVNMEFMKYYAVKQPITSVNNLPTTPSNFYDQIQLAEIGGVFSLYIYISNSWKKVTLT